MLQENILVSIVIPAYNEQVYLNDCLQSVLNQKTDFKYEIIVVDNNSSDNTLNIAKQAGIKVVIEPRQGVGRARRTGTKHTQGKYILHLDADTRLSTDYLTKMIKYFRNDSSLACLGGQLFFYDASWWLNLIRFPLAYFFLFITRLLSWGKLGPMGNNMMFPKELYNKTKGFCPKLHFGEDAHLCRQLSKFGQIKLNMKLHYFISARRFKINKPFLDLAWNFIKILLGCRITNYKPPHADKL